MKRLTILIAALLALAFTAAASAKTYLPKPHAKCKTGYVVKTVSKREMRGKRPHRRVVKVKVRECVSKPKVKPVTSAAAPAPAPAVRAAIDPSYTQNQTNPLIVTWAYDAGVNNGTLPDGTLSLTVYEHGQVASAGGCTIDVGGAITGGNCTLTLPAYGEYDVTVSYASSSASVAPSSSTSTEDIENPTAPGPAQTTTTLIVGPVSQTTLPPPYQQDIISTSIPLDLATTDPNPTYDITVTDTTTGTAATGTLDDLGPTCALQFGGPSTTTALSGCGITSMPFSYADTLTAVVTAEADSAYAASTSATVQVWSGSLLP